MKSAIQRRLVVEEDVEVMVNGRQILAELFHVWGLKPAHRAKGYRFFDEDEIRDALMRRDQGQARR